MVISCDNADRLIPSADVGTNGGTPWTRPSIAPASSATLLVTQYEYNAAGLVQDTIDPMDIDNRTYYDALGRTTETIQDYTDGTETADSNITTEYGYDGDNHVVYVRADEPDGSYQQTDYLYGVSTAHASWVNSNDILGAIEYPDPTTGQPSAAQEAFYHVTALGQPTQFIDRNGTVHGYGYDTLGRLIWDEVGSFGAGVDNAMTGIGYNYNSQGNLAQVTSMGSNPSTVEFVYNGLGQLTGDYQAHNGGSITASTPEVQYAYNEMANVENNSRLVSMTYPDGYTLNYNYNSGVDNSISRLSSISDASNTLESYKYLGLGTVVERDRPQIHVNQTFISQNDTTGDAGDQYVGLDRFGRVVNDNWYNTSTDTSTDDFQYGYDENGDVLYKQNLIDAAMSELYQYNNLDELIYFARGTLNSTDTGIVGTPSASQSWAPDALGNFDSVTTNGSTQASTFNQQNEITSISGQGTVSYDANGNLTADGSGNTYVYNAWNELVAVKNSSGTTIAAYGYDGLGRRITVTRGSTTTDLYYSAADQVVEEEVSGVPQARNVWSPVYVNAMILRDQSNQDDGVLEMRLYVQQDANWNVTALVGTASTVAERYDYLPYGTVTVLNGDFSLRGSTEYGVPYTWQGMRYEWNVNLYFAGSASGRVGSPTLQRWMQTDPIGLNGGTNDNEMEGDGPVDGLDPSGLDRLEYGRPDAAKGGKQAVYYIRRGYTIFGNFDQSPVFIGYLDPNTNEVYRKGYSVALATLEGEVNAWFHTTRDWDGFFRDKGTVVTNDGNDPRRVGWMAMQERAGVSVSRNERAGANEQYVKPLVNTAVLHNAGAGFNASPSRFAGGLPGGSRACPPTNAARSGRFVNCFPVDTPISTKDGLKPIQDVQASDLVWAYDLVDGQWKLRQVVETYQHDYVGDLVAITVAGEVIKATSGHPFWVVEGHDLEERPRPEHVPETPSNAGTPGRWVDAGDLRVGDVLLMQAGQQLPITELSTFKVCQKVYNFHVDELHCYAVGTGQVLVHNNSAINNIVNPGGKPIGIAGSSAAIREVAGSTVADAQAMFNQLSQGGTVITGSRYPGTLVRLPGGGTVGLRTVMTNSPGTIATIDVNVPGVTAVTKIKFNP